MQGLGGAAGQHWPMSHADKSAGVSVCEQGCHTTDPSFLVTCALSALVLLAPSSSVCSLKAPRIYTVGVRLCLIVVTYVGMGTLD